MTDVRKPFTQHELGSLTQRLCMDGQHCFSVRRLIDLSLLCLTGLLFCILIGSPHPVVLPWNTPCPSAARCHRLDPVRVGEHFILRMYWHFRNVLWMFSPKTHALSFDGLLLAHVIHSPVALAPCCCSTQDLTSQLGHLGVTSSFSRSRGVMGKLLLRTSGCGLCSCPHVWFLQVWGVSGSSKRSNFGRAPSVFFQPPPHSPASTLLFGDDWKLH